MKSDRAAREAFIFCAFICASPAFGQDWTPTGAPVTNWTSLACSADGTKVAAACSGAVFVSIDSGKNWIQTSAPEQAWVGIACSAAGTTLAAISTMRICVSTNTGGTWEGQWSYQLGPLVCSADGSRVVAGSGGGMHWGGGVLVSTNFGFSWDWAPNVGYCVALGASADTSTLVAGELNWIDRCDLAFSTNGGSSWTRVSSPAGPMTRLACSADAKVLFEQGYQAGLYRSVDAGGTWEWSPAPGVLLACAAEGSKLIVATEAGALYTSADSGASWVSNAAPVLNWSSATSSADGSRLYAAVDGGGIYTFQCMARPVLRIARAGNGLLISWIVPSMDFLLEESVDLKNWSALAVRPELNYTNLHYEVSLPAPAIPRFYRLASPM